MAIEIREIIIKTEIQNTNPNSKSKIGKDDLNTLKKRVLEECKRLIFEHVKRKTYHR